MKRYFTKTYFLFTIVLLIQLLLFSSCFTGVEGTKKISEKDVLRVSENNSKNKIGVGIDTLNTSDFKTWQAGKEFYVTDNQIKLILSSNSNITNTKLEGSKLYYDSFYKQDMFGTSKNVIVKFKDSKGIVYNYNTGKSLNEISNIQVPFLIDWDLINKARDIIKDKSLYIKTPLWYTQNDEAKSGFKFVQVRILDVLPGNKVYSLKVKFEASNDTSYVFVSTRDNSVANRSFGNIFSDKDPHLSYPTINNQNWNHIIHGEIVEGMTKDECRLSIGSPKNIDRSPTYAGLREFWQYDDGVYLIFMDGILMNYRK